MQSPALAKPAPSMRRRRGLRPMGFGMAIAALILAEGAGAGTPAATAQLDDPLHSPACEQALAALQAREDEAIAAASQRPVAAESQREPLRRARVAAARACLAEREDPPPVRRWAPPPQALAPAPRALPAPPRPAAAAAARSSAPQPAPPGGTISSLSHCDLAGCWLTDGTRLNRVGSLLVGPSGPCTVTAAAVSCPR